MKDNSYKTINDLLKIQIELSIQGSHYLREAFFSLVSHNILPFPRDKFDHIEPSNILEVSTQLYSDDMAFIFCYIAEKHGFNTKVLELGWPDRESLSYYVVLFEDTLGNSWVQDIMANTCYVDTTQRPIKVEELIAAWRNPAVVSSQNVPCIPKVWEEYQEKYQAFLGKKLFPTFSKIFGFVLNVYTSTRKIVQEQVFQRYSAWSLPHCIGHLMNMEQEHQEWATYTNARRLGVIGKGLNEWGRCWMLEKIRVVNTNQAILIPPDEHSWWKKNLALSCSKNIPIIGFSDKIPYEVTSIFSFYPLEKVKKQFSSKVNPHTLIYSVEHLTSKLLPSSIGNLSYDLYWENNEADKCYAYGLVTDLNSSAKNTY